MRSSSERRGWSRGYWRLAIVAFGVHILAVVRHSPRGARGKLGKAEFDAFRGNRGRQRGRRGRLGLGRRTPAHDPALEAFYRLPSLHHALHVGIVAEGVAEGR